LLPLLNLAGRPHSFSYDSNKFPLFYFAPKLSPNSSNFCLSGRKYLHSQCSFQQIHIFLKVYISQTFIEMKISNSSSFKRDFSNMTSKVKRMLRVVPSWYSSKRTSKIPPLLSNNNNNNNKNNNNNNNNNNNELILDPIVKVFSTTTSPNYFLPWQMKTSREVTGSGFVTRDAKGDMCIITNAHVVAHASFVSVRKFGSSTRFIAKVKATGHDADIAMLIVEDPSFWENLIPLEFGSLPELQDEVAVIGYPTGGDNISITRGVVSRIELQQYIHGAINLLCVQIDAAINSGNSGGPVLKGNLVVGIAFQNIPSAENIGFIIPVPVIDHFLQDIMLNGRYTGFPSLSIQCQSMENLHLRKAFSMNANQTGVLIINIPVTSLSHGYLKKDDVILSIDDISIANDGTIPFRRRGERISFDYILLSKFLGQQCKVHILRDGKEMVVNVRLSPRRSLVPVHSYDSRPSYFVYGGLVFTKLVQPYLHEYGEDWYHQSPRRLSYKAIYGDLENENQEIVILSYVLVDEINFGYNALTNLEVIKFNGTKIDNLKHLVEMVENNKQPYVRFDLDESMVIIMETAAVEQANLRILSNHYVPSSKSLDLIASQTSSIPTSS